MPHKDKGMMPFETRLKISNSLTGRPLSPEHKEKLAKAHRGRKASKETRHRQSESHKRYFETHVNLRKGVPTSDEQKAKQSQTMKEGYETGRIIKHFGVRMSEGTKEKMRLAIVATLSKPEIRAKFSGPRNWRWKGGRCVTGDGYVVVWAPGHMACRPGKNHVFEHRKVMAEVLGRPLTGDEYVHHRNGIRDDNRPENLRIVVRRVHLGCVRCPFCLKEFHIR